MLFDEAMAQCKPGQYVKSVRGGWSEYFVQYGRNEKGELFWTAGNTVGGPMLPKDFKAARKHDGDYAIYASFNAASQLSSQDAHLGGVFFFN